MSFNKIRAILRTRNFTYLIGLTLMVIILTKVLFYSEVNIQKAHINNHKPITTNRASVNESPDAPKEFPRNDTSIQFHFPTKVTSPSTPQILRKNFFEQILGTKNFNISIDSRGFWSGSDTARYHVIAHAHNLSKRLVQFFKQENAKSVLDLGGGAGQHVANLIQHGIFATCIDGNPEAQSVSNGTCSTMDLTRPMNLPVYDWVMSFSVGRQIPQKYENDFITNVDKLNKKGIVMYWGDGKPVSPDSAKKKLKTVRSNAEVIAKFESFGTYYNDPEAQAMLLSSGELKRNYSVVVLRKKLKQASPRVNQTIINLAVVSCGSSRLEETMTMIKSAVLFTQHTALKVYGFTDNGTLTAFTESMMRLKSESEVINANFDYEIQLTTFPSDIQGMTPWAEIFKPCSLERLFLPILLPNVDSLIYLDSDSIILSNLTELWNYFNDMNETQFIALSPLTADSKKSWFNYNQIPHYGLRGLNCGISLMNLTRMRKFGFQDHIYEIRRKYEHLRPDTSGDQFLQNVLYSFHPEFVYVFPCEWNLRRLHCGCRQVEICGCESGLENGVSLIHGTKNAFTDKTRLPLFRHIYEIMHVYNFKTDTMISMLRKLKDQFEYEVNSCFFNSSSRFYQKLENYIQLLHQTK